MRPILVLLPLLALAACQKPAEQPSNESAPAAQRGPVKGVDRSHKGELAPDVVFQDPSGEDTRIAGFTGRPVLVNLWASWCAPCVKELPTLEALARGNDTLEVVAVSQDTGPHVSVAAFLKTHKIAGLEAFHDPKMALSGALGVEVLPTSILYDGQGKEVWRYTGDLDWTGEEASRLLAEAGVAPAR